jgi:hypothetical protein
LINAAPEVMNTLLEVSKALGDDENYEVNIQNQFDNKQINGTCYLKSEMDIFLTGIAAGLNNRGLHSVVEIEGKSKYFLLGIIMFTYSKI